MLSLFFVVAVAVCSESEPRAYLYTHAKLDIQHPIKYLSYDTWCSPDIILNEAQGDQEALLDIGKTDGGISFSFSCNKYCRKKKREFHRIHAVRYLISGS